MSERFLIYNASAGAGKTYSLVRNYLKICLATSDHKAFISILAITFTNKAAREMKTRIIKQLKTIKAYPNLAEQELKYVQELATELKLKPEVLKYRASGTLSAILHNYAAFSVSTIDSFTNRLIRSFSKDLNLSANFQIEVRNDLILEEAVDRLLDEIERDTATTKILSRYIKQQLEDERSGDTKDLLVSRGMELFQERAFPFLEQLKPISTNELLAHESQLSKRLKTLLLELEACADEMLQKAGQYGLEATDFKRSCYYNVAEKIKKGNLAPFTATAIKALENDGPKSVASTKGKKTAALSDNSILEDFFSIGLKTYTLYQNSIEEIWIIKSVLGSLHGLALLGELEQRVEQITDETGRLPIGEFNKIISRELQQQPAPFLYERLGERYHNFFIDEFQDTSQLQWSNLLPLVNNALAQEGSTTMIVGDAKQSIYRFRGGDLQLFVDLFTGTDLSNTMEGRELYKRKVITLGQNFRSKSGLVEFNNSFFLSLSESLPNLNYQAIYKDGQQEAARQDGGYVTLEVFPKDAEEQDRMEALLHRVNSVLDRGFRQSDLCILVRSNSKGKAAAKFLIENKSRVHIPQGEALQILSADSLVIGASEEVRALVSFLKMTENPKVKESRKEWLAFICLFFSIEEPDQHAFKAIHAATNLAEEMAHLERECPGFNFEQWQGEDLLEKVYLLMRVLDMPWQVDPYLQFFLDQIQDYQEHKRPIVGEFLDWWLDKGHEKSVGIPEDTNAIQVMSIHKSKGLEFPVVFYLEVKDSLDKLRGGGSGPKTWVNLPPKYGLKFSLIELKKPPAPDFQPLFSEWYSNEVSKIMMDAINVHYVAFTRAELELHLFTSVAPKTAGKPYIEGFLMSAFEADEQGFYEIGLPESPEVKTISKSNLAVSSFESVYWRSKLETISDVPRHWQNGRLADALWGTKMHQLLAGLKKTNQLNTVLEKARNEAWFSEVEVLALGKALEDLFKRPDMEPYFHQDSTVYNERSILVPGQQNRIPDRLCCYREKWYIADYKTGIALKKHETQTTEYAYLLKEAGFPVAQAALIYLGEEPTVQLINF